MGAMQKILWPNRDEVTEEWRLHNEEVYDLYCFVICTPL